VCHQKNPFHPRSNLNTKVTKDFKDFSDYFNLCSKNYIEQLCAKLRATLCYKKKPPRPSATPPKEEKTKKEISGNQRLRCIRFIRVPKLKTHTFLLINSNNIISYKPNDIIHLNVMKTYVK